MYAGIIYIKNVPEFFLGGAMSMRAFKKSKKYGKNTRYLQEKQLLLRTGQKYQTNHKFLEFFAPISFSYLFYLFIRSRQSNIIIPEKISLFFMP